MAEFTSNHARMQTSLQLHFRAKTKIIASEGHIEAELQKRMSKAGMSFEKDSGITTMCQ